MGSKTAQQILGIWEKQSKAKEMKWKNQKTKSAHTINGDALLQGWHKHHIAQYGEHVLLFYFVKLFHKINQ